jgi:hypothetical protein
MVTGKASLAYWGEGIAAQSKWSIWPGNPSSLTIVPTAWLSARVALTALERTTKNVSFGSTPVSPMIFT